MLNAGRQRRQAQQQAGRGNVLDTKFSGKRKRKQKPVGWQAYSILFALLFLVALLVGLIVWYQTSTPAPDRPAAAKAKPEMASSSVQERGLVSQNVTWYSVLAEYGRPWSDTTHRHFLNPVLVYVTPWNALGYDMAKKFRAKFTHVSPVWYQLKRGREGLELLGKHDVDRKWVNDVRQKGYPMIVPRVVLEGWPLDMLVNPAEQKQAIDLIAQECKSMEYDGIVLEAWTAWAVYNILDRPNFRQKALEFVQALGTTLHSMKSSKSANKDRSMQLHFVIPPPSDIKRDIRAFTPADMTSLEGSVDGLSVMTYDFSSPNQPGPNAPTPWLKTCLRNLPTSKGGATSPKVLLGLNFYGNDYTLPQGGGPIIGHQYVALLEKYKPKFLWDEEAEEHRFMYDTEKENHVVYYPTLKSIAARLDEANRAGTGISIWEVGQGLEYFFDLL